MTQRVAIIGAFCTKFGEHWEDGLRDLASKAAMGVLKDVEELERSQIDGLFVGNASAEKLVGQGHIAPLIAELAGLHRVEATRVEAADASGGMALRAAYVAVRSGLYNLVMVLGVEKMTDQTSSTQITSTLSSFLDQEWEEQSGLTLAAGYAFMAKSHMEKYGTTREQIAAVPAKNHGNAVYNPNAHFRRKFTVPQVMGSPEVASPLGLLDCSPASDGGAAIIVASEGIAKKMCETPVWIEGSGVATDCLALHDRQDLHSMLTTRLASEKAFSQADLNLTDVDLVEVHDSFSIGEILALEDMGFFSPGKAGSATLEGETTLDGRLPVNASGGLKAFGHPLGATGVAQAAEITMQLQGRTEKKERQIKDAEIGVAQNVGGTGGTCVVHVLRR